MKVALWPLVVHSAPTPPSSAASFSSTYPTVGFEMREYMCPSDVRSKSAATASVVS